MSLRRELGAVLAVGNTATIHALGSTRVVKVMHADTPPTWADLEADWTARLHAVGLPVPEVLGLTHIEGRRAIVSRRIPGVTMLARIVARPATVAAHAGALAELQCRFHRLPAVAGLPRLRVRLTTKIRDAPLPEAVRVSALERLAALPDDDRLCHGDLHPGNVICADDGRLVVVDWFDVAAGCAAADVARTSLLVRPRPRAGPPRYLPGSDNELLGEFHAAYLDAHRHIAGVGHQAVSAWQLPVAAARMCEDVAHDLDDLASVT